MVAATRQGLKEVGYTEGQNLRIEYRWAEGQYDRLPRQAAELVAGRVAVIIAAGGTDPARAAKTATSAIPIVFVSAADPVRTGLVTSLSRPEGNVTGINMIGAMLEGKRLELLHEASRTLLSLVCSSIRNIRRPKSRPRRCRKQWPGSGLN